MMEEDLEGTLWTYPSDLSYPSVLWMMQVVCVKDGTAYALPAAGPGVFHPVLKIPVEMLRSKHSKYTYLCKQADTNGIRAGQWFTRKDMFDNFRTLYRINDFGPSGAYISLVPQGHIFEDGRVALLEGRWANSSVIWADFLENYRSLTDEEKKGAEEIRRLTREQLVEAPKVEEPPAPPPPVETSVWDRLD